jgi:hypothetical protein
MMSSSSISLLQILTGMLCAGAAFGVLLSMMLVRGNLQHFAFAKPNILPQSSSDSALFDINYTDKTYLLTSILASIGALVSFKQNIGVFVMFVTIAVSFQIAEHWLLPRMRQAAQQGLDIPMKGTRARFELLQAACLLFVFINLTMPPLVTLVRIHGL